MLMQAIATPTITAGAYTTGKAVGGMLTFTNALSGGSGLLKSVTISDKAAQNVALDLILFSQSFTATADTATLAISAADLLKCIGTISLAAASYKGLAASTNSIVTSANIDLGMVATSDNNLYGQLVARGSGTYTSTSDLQVRVVVDVLKG